MIVSSVWKEGKGNELIYDEMILYMYVHISYPTYFVFLTLSPFVLYG